MPRFNNNNNNNKEEEEGSVTTPHTHAGSSLFFIRLFFGFVSSINSFLSK